MVPRAAPVGARVNSPCFTLPQTVFSPVPPLGRLVIQLSDIAQFAGGGRRGGTSPTECVDSIYLYSSGSSYRIDRGVSKG